MSVKPVCIAGSGNVTENTGLFIACAALKFLAASQSMVAQSFLRLSTARGKVKAGDRA